MFEREGGLNKNDTNETTIGFVSLVITYRGFRFQAWLI